MPSPADAAADPSLDDLITRHGSEPATIAICGAMINTLLDIIGEDAEAHRAQIKALEARVLELEASAAAVRS